MLFNIKTAAAAALGLGAIAFWVPKLFGGEEAATEEFSVDSGDPTGGAFVDDAGGGAMEAPAEQATAAPRSTAQASGPGESDSPELSRSSSPAAVGSADLEPDEVLELVAKLRGGAPAAAQPVAAGPPNSEAPADVEQPAPEQAISLDMELFRRDHALGGVLIGDSSRALIGHEIVLEGDTFADGRARLVKVSPARVVVEVQGERTTLLLPPFRPAPPASDFDFDDPEPGV